MGSIFAMLLEIGVVVVIVVLAVAAYAKVWF